METASSKRSAYAWLLACCLIFVVGFMLLLVFNTGEWQQVGQTAYTSSQCSIKFSQGLFEFEVLGKRVQVDSMRILFSPDASDTAITVTTFRRNKALIGDPDESIVAEVTVCGPPLASTTLMLKSRW